MKAEMIKRLVRAIAAGSQDDLDRLADLIVESERTSGHSRLSRLAKFCLASGAPVVLQ